ncbi:type VI secretion system membrane subunit TssM [Sulfitobacter sp. JBTF-M27]|uniref:Type VI secretion system membrane subunit TssM n=1 Tax=Sulfitobacter sediminilitoris TaxID=2698830 RepID=A0A6P0CFP8_9RHOB|nr:type VI secretion system membrane subunit TssM [Sulfitobacter sediminilitoris]NEK24078.1 type VI secretion system membrane subunit TssM [Sulfitobacter sediminilitoris]
MYGRRILYFFFKSIYSILLLVAITLSVAVWFLAPFIGSDSWRPFDSIMSRSIFIGGIWFFFIGLMLFIFLRRRRKEKAMTEEIAETVDDGADDVTSAELGELRDKLKTAMAELRKSKNGRKHLNELPWYVMIGPPGAGKTTAIVNSGLKFPLAESMGKTAIGGVGGTRNCDWWFTNDAVLIDTAGRYTTQESDADTDNAGWLGFLGLLKKYRKRQPINGAMIAISLSDLLMQDEVTQASHALAVRRRLNELREKLGVRFPVYVLFTKADLIAGFSEFYDNLGKEDREQVWGFTLPLDVSKDETSPVAAFDSEFALLLGQLNAQSLERMQNESDPQRRSMIAGFPPQVAAMRSVARNFLIEVFQDNRYQTRHMLRGIYFTSGTQEGTPIDRLMLGMARTFGIGRQAIGTGQGQGRSYFLTRLFEGVIFPEAGLVSADDKVERRYRWTKRAAIAATVVVALGTGTLFTRSYLGNQDLIEQASTYVDSYQQLSATLPGSPVGDTDLPPVVDALNVLRDMPTNPTAGDPDPERRLTYGLYQGEVIGTQAAQTYRAALNQRLLPRLLLRLEDQITGNVNNPDLLYEALKIYLMLGLEGPMNAVMVKEWMNIDWSITFAGPGREALRRDLAFHLDALLSQPMAKVSLNGPLVEQVQGILSEMPLAQRVYNGIINSPSATSLPEWRITEAGGPAVARVLVRSSGKPLNEGVEGIFTYDGFNNVFLGEALGVAKRIQRDSWVLGPRGVAEQTDGALTALSRDVLNLYYNDYIAKYDTILGDIDVIPLESLAHAVEVTNVLSGPTSPLVNILNEISEQTKLTEDRSLLGSAEVSDGLGRVAQIEARSALSIQGEILLEALQNSATGENGAPPKPPGAYVEERFQWIHTLVERPEGQNSQLDMLIATLQEVYQELNKMSFSGVAATAVDGGTATQRFQQMAARIPGPLERWASQITTGSTGITADGTRSSINATWQSNVLPFCTQALENRYPFNRRARADVAMADFQKLFAPGGMIDAFFSTNLSKYVDTRSRPWTWKKVNDVDLGISPAVLQQLQYAAEIRDAFFAGGANPQVQFQITPEALDPKADSVQLTIGSQNVLFETRRPNNTPVAITWPGTVGLAGVVFQPQLQNGESQLAKDGPWAWFRLLDAAEIRRTNVSDRKRVIFNVAGRIAIFQLQSGSVINPFALPALSKFNCPKTF